MNNSSSDNWITRVLNNEISPYRGGYSKLKNTLVKLGYKEYKCSICGLSEWNGKPIPLEVNHIDGNNKNNSLSNIRFVCRNCYVINKISTPWISKKR